MIYTLYLSSLCISTVVSSVMVSIFWRRRSIRGAIHVAWLMLSAAIYSFGTVLQLVNTELSDQITAESIQYIGIAFLSVAWFTFSISYTGRDSWLTKKVLALLLIIPVITIIFAWTNSYHELIWSNRHLESSGPFIIIAKNYGPWFWVNAIYSYTLLLLGTMTLIRRLFRRPFLYFQQSIALLIAVIVPVVWNILYVFNVGSLYRIDLTPSFITVSGLAMLWGLFRSRLFDIVPIAYENIMEVLNQGIVILDNQNRIIDMNSTAEKIFACPISKAIGCSADAVFSGLPDLKRIINDELTDSLPEISIKDNGKERSYILQVSLLNDNKGNLIGRMLNLTDNTEFKQIQERRKELEDRNQLMSRLSTVGEMAAGIAHEVSNPLGTVLGYAELLLKYDLPDDVRADLEIVEKGAKRAAIILERLLIFAGQQSGEREPVNIIDIVESAIEFRRHSLTGNGIDVVKKFNDRLPAIMANGSQLQEVFLNIIMNAESSIIEAGHKGNIIITTGVDRDSLYISFNDDGNGIEPEILKKIFNPFFTTKKVGKGTGLGLSICHGIISRHGGEISVESEPGEGSTFTIKLPVLKLHYKAVQHEVING